MKGYTILLLSLFCCSLQAQQLSQFSQYLDNNYLINPAATDLQNNIKFGMGFRQQWGDIPGNPRTLYLTAYAPLSKPEESQYMRASMRMNGQIQSRPRNELKKSSISHVLGTVIMSDDFGLFNKTTVHFSYGIHLPLTKKLSISAAPKIGVVNLNLNDDLWVLDKNDDPFKHFLSAYSSKTLLDIGFGLWLYSDKFFMGYSLEQMGGKNPDQLGETTGYETVTHHFMSLGYSFSVNPYMRIVPSSMIRYSPTGPISIDYSLRFEYQSRIWLGLSLRKSNALVGLFGLFLNSNIKFNYTYDHGMGSGDRDGLNAHEFSLNLSAFQNLYKE
ncbi:MAG: PorP/SprF family type IX secretion system membrane protein [Roseivirga sp.]|jgi:type IX secretion system PorP/SprF family membrane protein|uniref:PorP/SprF family type IX secretion system membrane protein n=1 Tax=Roseivirga sp. TaxID=1964215 RepID=UPI001B143B32|nr:PorP/SprF family type IX secretion system membrane protein [Roseivirga sp.]MBO6497557.1 PorP/SprF family type IX secretion system membrane protein [Roseivirga sp.]